MVAEADRPVKLVSASEGYRILQYASAALRLHGPLQGSALSAERRQRPGEVARGYADVTPSRRWRIAAVVARSMAVQAIARAPSTSAWSAAGVTQWAANSGWWFVAGSELMPILGWMDGSVSDTLPISVEPPGRDGAVGSGKMRPRASALRRYAAPMSGSWRNWA